MADNPEYDFLASSTADPSMTLGEAAYVTGAIGSSFAPGAGVADVMGYAPDPFNPGQMLPSFSENLSQGNYLDAGIQTLGLAGDAFYAAAPFTAGITALPGGVLKGAQALAKTLRGGTIPNPKTTTPQVFFPDLGEKSHVTLQPDVKNDAVSISYIEADKPGQGQGGEMLRRVTEQADATGTRLTLYPDARGEGGLDQDELIKFYQRNGFKFQYPDPTNPDPILDMVREPRPTAPKSTGLLGGDKPQRFYHGTREEFKEFDPDAPYTFVADKPSTAEYYAGDVLDGAPNIRPVYLKDVNFFDVDNPSHMEQLLESDWYAQYGKSLDDAFFDYSEDMNFLDLVEAGDYGTIEDSGLVDWIKSQGFDGFTTYEQDGKNYAVFDVNNIVPGVVKKKEGGVISLVDVARNMNRGPRGVESLAPIARNMYRTMVS